MNKKVNRNNVEETTSDSVFLFQSISWESVLFSLEGFCVCVCVRVCSWFCSGEEEDCSPNTPVAPQLSLRLLITLLQSSLSRLRLTEEEKIKKTNNSFYHLRVTHKERHCYSNRHSAVLARKKHTQTLRWKKRKTANTERTCLHRIHTKTRSIWWKKQRHLYEVGQNAVD